MRAPGLILGSSMTGTSGGRMLEILTRLMLPMPAASSALSKALRGVPPSAWPAVAAAIVIRFVIRSILPSPLLSRLLLQAARRRTAHSPLYGPRERMQEKSVLTRRSRGCRATPRPVRTRYASAEPFVTAARELFGDRCDAETSRRRRWWWLARGVEPSTTSEGSFRLASGRSLDLPRAVRAPRSPRDGCRDDSRPLASLRRLFRGRSASRRTVGAGAPRPRRANSRSRR